MLDEPLGTPQLLAFGAIAPAKLLGDAARAAAAAAARAAVATAACGAPALGCCEAAGINQASAAASAETDSCVVPLLPLVATEGTVAGAVSA